jgi:hypothetical protein
VNTVLLREDRQVALKKLILTHQNISMTLNGDKALYIENIENTLGANLKTLKPKLIHF